MNGLHDVRIEADGPARFRVFIDDKEIRGVTRVELELDVEEFPRVALWFVPETVNSSVPVMAVDGLEPALSPPARSDG